MLLQVHVRVETSHVSSVLRENVNHGETLSAIQLCVVTYRLDTPTGPIFLFAEI